LFDGSGKVTSDTQSPLPSGW